MPRGQSRGQSSSASPSKVGLASFSLSPTPPSPTHFPPRTQEKRPSSKAAVVSASADAPSQASPLKSRAPPRDASPPKAPLQRASAAAPLIDVSSFAPREEKWVLDTDPRQMNAERMLGLMEQERTLAVMKAAQEQQARKVAELKQAEHVRMAAAAAAPLAEPEDPVEQARKEYESVARELMYLQRASLLAEAQYSDTPVESHAECTARLEQLQERLSLLDKVRALRMEEYVSSHVQQALDLHEAAKKRARKLAKKEAKQQQLLQLQATAPVSPPPPLQQSAMIAWPQSPPHAAAGGGHHPHGGPPPAEFEVVVSLQHPEERVGVRWTGDARKGHIKVERVEADGAGVRAGIVEGWKLVRVNNTPMRTAEDIRFGVAQLRAQGYASFFFKRKMKRDLQLATAEERELRREHKTKVKAIRMEGQKLRAVWDRRQQAYNPASQRERGLPEWATAEEPAAFNRWQMQRQDEVAGVDQSYRHPGQQTWQGQGPSVDRRSEAQYNPYMPAQQWVASRAGY